MSASILKFPAKPVLKPAGEAGYFCTQCDGEEFRISPIGTVRCVRCAALMNNLLCTTIRS